MTYSLRKQFSVEGQVAVITGAAGILGPEFGAALAEFGAGLALVDVDETACHEVADRLRGQYDVEVLAIGADVSSEDAVVSFVEETLGSLGRIDVLVNAAAAKTDGYFDSLGEYNLETWDRVMTVNLTGMLLTTKHIVAYFIEREKGNIINISSIYGVVGPDPRTYVGSRYLGHMINTPPVYAASKGGVISFTRYLATTLASHNIRANCIIPGGVFSGQNEKFVEQYSRRVPLGRMAERQELRGALLYLASDASSYVTGQNLIVDGGWTAW